MKGAKILKMMVVHCKLVAQPHNDRTNANSPSKKTPKAVVC